MGQEPVPAGETPDERGAAGKKANEHLANVRTALAWIRTGLAMIGLGFVISRFGLLLRAQPRPELPPSTIHYSTLLGLALVAVGVLTLLGAFCSFLRIHWAIEHNQFLATPWFLAALLGFLVILGGLLFLYMWLVG